MEHSDETKSKKFYLEDGSIVTFGNQIQYKQKQVYTFGEITKVEVITVTPDNYKYLIERGILSKAPDKKKIYEVPCLKDIEEIIRIIADKYNLSKKEVINTLDTLGKINKVCLIRVMLKEMADYYNAAYDKDIIPVYGINVNDGSIFMVNKDQINSNVFALFISDIDAINARNLIAHLF